MPYTICPPGLAGTAALLGRFLTHVEWALICEGALQIFTRLGISVESLRILRCTLTPTCPSLVGTALWGGPWSSDVMGS